MKRSRLFPTLALLLLALVAGTVLLRPGLREQKPQLRPPAPPVLSDPPAAPASPTPPPEAVIAPAAPPNAAPGSKDPAPSPVEIRGRVVDVKGNPMAFARIEGYARDAFQRHSRLEAESDDKGAFRMPCPLHARVTLTAHLPGHGRAFYTVDVTDPSSPGSVNDITLSFRAPTAFDGILTGPKGEPVAGAKLRFHPFSNRYGDPEGKVIGMNLLQGQFPPDEAWDRQCRESLFLTDETVSSDAQGKVRAQSLVAGVNYIIEVECPGRNPDRLEVHVRGQKEPVRLQLPP
jgi:hypothetical protein